MTTRAFDRYPGLQSTWTLRQSADLTALSSSLLTVAGCANLFTLRPHNMGRLAERDQARFAAGLGVEACRFVRMQQVHGAEIACVDADGSGGRLEGVDGMIVDRPGWVGLALSADCPLIAVTAPGLGAFGLAHAGWRGTVAGIAGDLIDAMVKRTGCRTQELVAAIAPSAGPCCYEVGPEVVRQAGDTLADHEQLFVRSGQAVCFDLRTASIAQLLAAGLKPERIDLARPCTICDRRFHSYRRDGATAGRSALLVAIKSD
ncbi:MAG: polyphenol oxidase family protein [Phycisphaerae bacterium]